MGIKDIAYISSQAKIVFIIITAIFFIIVESKLRKRKIKRPVPLEFLILAIFLLIEPGFEKDYFFLRSIINGATILAVLFFYWDVINFLQGKIEDIKIWPFDHSKPPEE